MTKRFVVTKEMRDFLAKEPNYTKLKNMVHPHTRNAEIIYDRIVGGMTYVAIAEKHGISHQICSKKLRKFFKAFDRLKLFIPKM